MKKHFFILLSAVMLLSSCSEAGSVSDIDNSELNSVEPKIETNDESSEESGEPAEDVTITLAVYNALNGTFQKYFDEFNAMDNGYKIVTKDYHEYVDETVEDPMLGSSLADMRLFQDIVKGGEVDLVYSSSFFNNGSYEALQSKGAFADLNSFMENEQTFERSELNEHILSLYEDNGSLHSMPVFYRVESLLGAKKYVGDRYSWTVDELIDCYNNAPENATFGLNHDKVHVFLTLTRANLGSFVDYKNGTTNFNCPEFINLIEFCDRFEDDFGANNVDLNSPLFVKDCTFDSFEQFHNSMWEFSNIYSKGEEGVLIGYPTDSRNGAYIDTYCAFSICSTSSDKAQKGSWEFIKTLISEDSQNEILSETEAGFPINNRAFEKYAESSVGTGENIVSMNGNSADIGYFSQEEYELLVEYINNTDCAKTTVYDDLNRMITEEVYALFRGEQTAEQAAEYIQNRASIMVSEKAG